MPEPFKYQSLNEFAHPAETIEFLGRTLKLINWGRHRNTYDDGKFVVKVPRNESGRHDNYREADLFKFYREQGHPDGQRLARCRVLKNGYLVMEKLETRIGCDWDKLPKWANYIDCGQVGLDRKGVYKAYDYAE